ncbi:MAG: hypothetical protein WAW26_02915, partial [Anaerolineae bacterium]
MTHSRTPAQSSYLRQSAADLLRWPLLGRFLRWRHSRTTVQTVFLILSAVLIFDGLTGPSLAPKNLATVTSWIQYRGFLVLSLLVIGNLFCFACPFMLPRRLGKWLQNRFLAGGRPLPRALRSKWLALVILTLYFFTYERWDLWASPWLTAWVIVGYFVVAFTLDTFFQGAAFCKTICPVGQFNFFGSLVSPSEIKVRDAAVCVTCKTKDCIRGRPLAGSAKRKVQNAEHRVQSAEHRVQSAEYKVQSAEGDAASSGRRATEVAATIAKPAFAGYRSARGATEVATANATANAAANRTPIALFDHVQPGCELNLFQPVKVGNQ